MNNRMLVFGDINVDIMMGGLKSLPVVDREITCESFDVVMGSSAAIFACAYARLGGTVSFVGLAGQDDYGEFMIRGLQEFGIDTSLIRRTGRVRTGVTLNLIYRNTRTQVTYPGTIAEFDGSDIDGSMLREFGHVHFAGPYQQTKFRPHLTRILQAACRLGLSSSLDTQWDATQGWEFIDEWLPLLTYLFVNEDEAVSITRASCPESASQALCSRTRGPIIKAGSKGAMLQVGNALVKVPSFEIEVVDTTGAGDVFDAAFLFAVLEKRMDWLPAAEFAAAAAARSCLFVGGVAARSTFEDVVAFARRRACGESSGTDHR